MAVLSNFANRVEAYGDLGKSGVNTSGQVMLRAYSNLVTCTELLLRHAKASARLPHAGASGGGRVSELEERLAYYRSRLDYWEKRTTP
jgi:hypothetical protein